MKTQELDAACSDGHEMKQRRVLTHRIEEAAGRNGSGDFAGAGTHAELLA